MFDMSWKRGNHLNVVDLTHPLDESVPTWGGGCGFRLEIKMDYDKGLCVQSIKSHAGVGTHMDAPSHFIRGAQNIGEIPLQELMVPLAVLHLNSRVDPDLLISVTDIREFEKKWGAIPKKALFVAYTGWERYWGIPEKYRNVGEDGKMHFPGFSKEAAEYLLEKQISGIGIDSLSPDGSNNGEGADQYPVHQVVLGAGKYILENLANLSQMPAHGHVICLPPKMSKATESACRVVGFF